MLRIGVFGPVGNSLEAHQMLVRFFDLFGIAGIHLPGVVLITMLLIQHILSKDPFEFSGSVWLKMVAESAFLTGPLIVLVIVLQPGSGGGAVAHAAASVGAGSGGVVGNELVEAGRVSGLVLSLGASLYEEMLFRVVLITMIHFLICDVLGFRETRGFVIAILISSAAFAWHHDQIFLADRSIDWGKAFFYFLAGMYFGMLYLMRGLGIAVGVHLMYDLLVLVVLPSFRSS